MDNQPGGQQALMEGFGVYLQNKELLVVCTTQKFVLSRSHCIFASPLCKQLIKTLLYIVLPNINALMQRSKALMKLTSEEKRVLLLLRDSRRQSYFCFPPFCFLTGIETSTKLLVSKDPSRGRVIPNDF